jgi:co-chaperonin GroES (HSP10)
MEDRMKSTLERIDNIFINEAHSNINIGYIPLAKEVVMTKVVHGEIKVSGIILAESTKASSPLARIVAIGPECSQYLRKGLLVRFNPMVNVEERVNGVDYIFADEYAVRGIVEDELKVKFYPKNPTPKQIAREKGLELNKVAKNITKEKLADMENKDADKIARRKKAYKASNKK